MSKFQFKCTDGIRTMTIEVRDDESQPLSPTGYVPDLWAKQWCKIHRLEFINLVSDESVAT